MLTRHSSLIWLKPSSLLLFLLPITGVSAQTASLDYGLKAGFSLSQHYAPYADDSQYEVGVAMRPGLIAGAWLDMNVLPHFALGYELLFSQKGSREEIRVLKIQDDLGGWTELDKPALMNLAYDLDYLEMPILLKVKTLERGKLSLEAIAGTAFGYLVRGRHKLEGTFFMPISGTTEFDEVYISQGSNLKYVNKFDYGMVYGTAIHYAGKVRLSAEFRFTLGWDYLQLPTFTMDDIEVEPAELRNQTYSAILGIQF